jgi:glycosyltransferase involved in cell wall biosynthesis
MSNQPLISVIVPLYNVEQYLEECIKSIIEQTYKNWELILVDDGSTDNSGNICDTWATYDSRIIIIHSKNGGVAKARNIGIDKAKGDFIIFCDSDDMYTNQSFEKMISYQEESGADVVIGQFEAFFDNPNVKNDLLIAPTDIEGEWGINEFYSIYASMFPYQAMFVWTKLISRKIFDNGVRFIENVTYEDSRMMPQVYAQSKKVKITKDMYYMYRQRSGSIIHSVPKCDSFMDLFDSQHSLLEAGLQIGVENLSVPTTLNFLDGLLKGWKYLLDNFEVQDRDRWQKEFDRRNNWFLNQSFNISMGKCFYQGSLEDSKF